jgi:hypothetical protein
MHGQIKLNPLLKFINFNQEESLKRIIIQILKDNRGELTKLTACNDKNFADAAAWASVYDIIFKGQGHLSVLAKKKTITGEHRWDDEKHVLVDIFTSRRITIKDVTLQERIDDFKKVISIPQQNSIVLNKFTYFSIVQSKFLKKFTKLSILEDYKIKTFQDLIMFRIIEDIKMNEQITKVIEKDEIFFQNPGNSDKKILIFSRLFKENKLDLLSIEYLTEYYPLIKSCITKEITKMLNEAQTKKIEACLTLIKNKNEGGASDELLQIINDETEELTFLKENKELAIEELTKDFFKALDSYPIEKILAAAFEEKWVSEIIRETDVSDES